jgi:transcriptional regulator with XRE-family HTH domain
MRKEGIIMSELLGKIGRNIRHYRLERELTQKQLAKKAKISRGYMNRIENGRINLYLDTLVDIAREFGVSPGDLVK